MAGFLRNAFLVWSPHRFCSFLRHCLQIWCDVSCTVNCKEIISPHKISNGLHTMAHVLICFGWKTSNYINHRIHYQTRFNNNQLALSQTMHTVCQPIPSQHVPKILGTQRDAGTWLATALHRRPFSACNKGNRRRLHAGNIQKWPVKMTGQTRVWPVKPTIRPDIVPRSGRTLSVDWPLFWALLLKRVKCPPFF